jgi:hypothetical protein
VLYRLPAFFTARASKKNKFQLEYYEQQTAKKTKALKVKRIEIKKYLNTLIN